MDDLTNWAPKDILVNHGPKKLLVSKYHRHLPQAGVVASYTPTDNDVEDHFGVFRGVDQIEAFAQAANGSCSVFLECKKQNLSPIELAKKLVPLFTGIGHVNFYNYLEKGDTFVSIGFIKSYKFRQMICTGKLFKVPTGLDLDEYFSTFNEQQLKDCIVSDDFTLIAEFGEVTGRAIKRSLTEK
jgi:hypothetical protein